MTVPSRSARSSRRREAAHHPTPRLDAWTKRLTHGLVITAIAIGLLYLSGVEDRSLERAVERSAREHDSHVQQDSGGGTSSRASIGGTSGLRGQATADVVGAAALSDAPVDTDTVDDAGADDDINDDGDDDLPDVDPEGQLQEEFKQEVTQAGMDELKSFLKAGDADPSESLDEDDDDDEDDEDDEGEEEKEEESGTDGVEAVGDNDESNGTDDSNDTNAKGGEKEPEVSEDAAVTSDAGTDKASEKSEDGDKSDTTASGNDGGEEDSTKTEEKGAVEKVVASSTKRKKTLSAKTADTIITKTVAALEDPDTPPGDKDADGKDDTDIVDKIVEKAATVVKKMVGGEDKEPDNTQDSGDGEDVTAEKKVKTPKDEDGNSKDDKDQHGESNSEDESTRDDGENQQPSKGTSTTKKKKQKVEELVADSVVATSNATQAAKAAVEEANVEEQGTVVDKIAEKISEADAVLEKAADVVKKAVVGGDSDDASSGDASGKDDGDQSDNDEVGKVSDTKASKGDGPDSDTAEAASDTKEQNEEDGGGDDDGDDDGDKDGESADTTPSQKEGNVEEGKKTVSVQRRDGTAEEVNAEDIGNTETKKVTAVVP